MTRKLQSAGISKFFITLVAHGFFYLSFSQVTITGPENVQQYESSHYSININTPGTVLYSVEGGTMIQSSDSHIEVAWNHLGMGRIDVEVISPSTGNGNVYTLQVSVADNFNDGFMVGPRHVNVEETSTYLVRSWNQLTGINWVLHGGGQILHTWSEYDNVYGHYVEAAEVLWDIPGDHNIELFADFDHFSENVSVIVPRPANPTIEPIPNQCEIEVRMSLEGPSSGFNWYWQQSANGVDTGNNNPDYIVSESSTFYLRAQHHSSGDWSIPIKLVVDVEPPPAKPSQPNISGNIYGTKTLSYNNPSIPPLDAWYWQGIYYDGANTDLNVTSNNYEVTSSGTYYVRALTHNCWSEPTAVYVSVKYTPDIPTQPTLTYSEGCASATLTRNEPPEEVTWYWQGTNANGTSMENSDPTYTVSAGGTYYLRPKVNGGAWGTSRGINVTIDIPTQYNIMNDGFTCTDGNHYEGIKLSGSESNITYQLRKDGVNVGAPIQGTGSSISFGNFGDPSEYGTYTIIGTNTSLGCSVDMIGSVSISEYVPPVNYAITGDGVYNDGGVCDNDGPFEIGLANSELGVSYQLERDGTNVGSAVSGTGNPISFGMYADVGKYKVEARRVNSACRIYMSGSFRIAILPTVFNLQGDDQYYEGAQGTVFELSGSETGVSYQLQRDGISVGSPIDGTGVAINFSPQTTAGTYSILASSFGCTRSMNGTIDLEVIPTNIPPSPDQNYVRVEVPHVPVNSQHALSTLGPKDKSTSFNYSDGLGRPTMSVAMEAGQDFEDLIQFNEYNAEGRQENKYMSYLVSRDSPGSYQDLTTTKNEQSSFYRSEVTNLHVSISGDPKAYSKTDWDARGRVKSVVAPGLDWHANDIKTTYDYAIYDPSSFDLAVEDTWFQEAVPKWKIIGGLPSRDGTYQAKELSITSMVDMQELKSRALVDVRGLQITSQVHSQGRWIGSFNVYDDFGRVRFVIPPLLATIPSPTQEQVNELAFQYEYDSKGRIKRERAPGAGWVEYVYDHWNRLVLTRHAAQVKNCNEQGENCDTYWTYYKYDALNRRIMSGEIKDNRDHEALQAHVLTFKVANQRFEQRTNSSLGYTNDASFPSSSIYTDIDTLTVNYFDDYDFLNYSGWDTEGESFDLLVPDGFSGIGQAPSQEYILLTEDTELTGHLTDKYAHQMGVVVTIAPEATLGTDFELILADAPYDNLFGQPTGSKVKILGSEVWLNTAVYYDEYRRVVQTVSENHKGGVDRITNDLEWDGELNKILVQHSSDFEQLEILTEYEYAHNGQLLKTYETIGEGNRVLVGDYHYNVLGELTEKNLHSVDDGSSFLQSVDYRYNLQGAIVEINNIGLTGSENDLFGMRYYFERGEDVAGATTAPRYDGMVSAIAWNATNETPSSSPVSGPKGNERRALGFIYDEQNRLSSTSYGTTPSGYTFDQNVGDYTMSVGTYDDNGNIQSLNRNAGGEMVDQLSYNYRHDNGTPNNYDDDFDVNKLRSVDDSSNGLNKAIGMDDPMPQSGDIVTEYAYNSMGNMIEDDNRKIQKITYNLFQLVESIEFTDGAKVSYIYDAARNRLAKEVLDADGNSIAKVDYVGLVEYLDDEINQVFTDEGRAYKQNDVYHYEYFITDHQGNNRVAFGNLPERNIYVATMEDNRSSYETTQFTFPTNNSPITGNNHTPLGAKSIALNGANTNKQLGPMKVLEIQPNDVVEIEVFAKYIGNFTNGTGSGIGDFLSLFNIASAGTGAEGSGTTVQSMLAQPSLFQSGDNNNDEPEAYLQYIFFDANYNFENLGSGYKSVESDSNGSFSKLSSGELTFGEAGYLLVYVANESVNTNKDVFFDDLKITHSSATASFKVSQVNDFYPFGLPMSNSWRSPGYIDPGLLYQAPFATLDSLTGFYDFLSRNYDPVLGRFPQVDPANQFNSPYLGMANNPHQVIDPNGEFSIGDFFASLAGQFAWNAAGSAGQALVGSLNGNGSFSQNFQSQGFNIGTNYNFGSGFPLNSTSGYGITSPQGGGSPLFTGFGKIHPYSIGTADGYFGPLRAGYWDYGSSIRNHIMVANNSGLIAPDGFSALGIGVAVRSYRARYHQVQFAQSSVNDNSNITSRHPYDYGSSLTLSASIAVMGGAHLEVGVAWDNDGDVTGIFTWGASAGIDASIGILAKSYTAIDQRIGFDITDLAGEGKSQNVGVWFLDGTYGGDIEHAYGDFGKTYVEHGFGVSLGLPLGYSYERSKTSLFWTRGN